MSISDSEEADNDHRLAYAWVLVDQELALFYDTPTLLLITDLSIPMPDVNGLWQATSAQDWLMVFEQTRTFSSETLSMGSGMRPGSLRDCFTTFLNDTPECYSLPLTALHLRLLLHPLQSLVCQFRHLQACLPDANNFAATTQHRLDEVTTLLARWYSLSEQYLSTNGPCPIMYASLIIFHLINLAAVSSIPDIERMARGESVDGSYQSVVWAHRSCVVDAEKALFHSGQVLRLVQVMPRSIRPPWWAAAVYRASLVLWCQSLVHNGLLKPASGLSTSASQVPLDQLEPRHPLLLNYVEKGEGTPVLTQRDQSFMALDNPAAVLGHCVGIIADGVQSRFTEGLCSKLMRLARN